MLRTIYCFSYFHPALHNLINSEIGENIVLSEEIEGILTIKQLS